MIFSSARSGVNRAWPHNDNCFIQFHNFLLHNFFLDKLMAMIKYNIDTVIRRYNLSLNMSKHELSMYGKRCDMSVQCLQC